MSEDESAARIAKEAAHNIALDTRLRLDAPGPLPWPEFQNGLYNAAYVAALRARENAIEACAQVIEEAPHWMEGRLRARLAFLIRCCRQNPPQIVDLRDACITIEGRAFSLIKSANAVAYWMEADIRKAVDAASADLVVVVREAVDAETEACARAVCPDCAEGFALDEAGHHFHGALRQDRPCPAHPIRQRAANRAKPAP